MRRLILTAFLAGMAGGCVTALPPLPAVPWGIAPLHAVRLARHYGDAATLASLTRAGVNSYLWAYEYRALRRYRLRLPEGGRW